MYSKDSQFHTSSFKQQKLQATDIKTHRKNEYSFASPIRQTFDHTESDNKKSFIKSSINNDNSQQFNLFSKYKFRSPLREQ